MKTYRIEHYEELVDYFYIQANSASEALEKFDADVASGKIDLSQMDRVRAMITASNTAEEVPDD